PVKTCPCSQQEKVKAGWLHLPFRVDTFLIISEPLKTIQMYRKFTEIRKWRFLMRVSFAYLFLLIGGIQLLSASNSRGQGLEDIMVTIEVNEDNLESLLKRIEHQTPLTFAYLPSDVQKYNQVTLKPGKQTVKFALDQALEHTALSYR